MLFLGRYLFLNEKDTRLPSYLAIVLSFFLLVQQSAAQSHKFDPYQPYPNYMARHPTVSTHPNISIPPSPRNSEDRYVNMVVGECIVQFGFLFLIAVIVLLFKGMGPQNRGGGDGGDFDPPDDDGPGPGRPSIIPDDDLWKKLVDDFDPSGGNRIPSLSPQQKTELVEALSTYMENPSLLTSAVCAHAFTSPDKPLLPSSLPPVEF